MVEPQAARSALRAVRTSSRQHPSTNMATVKVDMISQLQDHLSGICLLFVNFTGAIQRDAPPASVGSHAVDPVLILPDRPTLPDTKELAQDLVQAFKVLDGLISQIPDLKLTEEQQLEVIKDLQEENDRVATDLRKQTAATEQVQQQVQELYGTLAGFLLR